MRPFVIASAAALLTLSGAAGAEPSGTLLIKANRALAENQRSVAYADLQLASASGRAELRDRIGKAITDLCDPRRFSVAEPTDSLKCAAQAWADITPRLDALAPRLASR